MARSTTRLNISLPSEWVSEVDHWAEGLGISRSAMLWQLLLGPVQNLEKLRLQDHPERPEEWDREPTLRARGASVMEINDRVRKALNRARRRHAAAP